MMMLNSINQDEGNNNKGWKQVGSGKTARTDKTDKTGTGAKKEDGMASYAVKIGVIEVRFMTATGKGCNMARSINEFLVAARATNEEFTLMSSSGIGNNMYFAADVSNTKDGIEGYYRHVVKFNNIKGTMRIRISLNIRKLKRPGIALCLYIYTKCVYINKNQLGTEEGFSLGWIHKAHPAFAFCDDMKDQLQSMTSKDFKDMKYTLFHCIMTNKRGSDGTKLMTNGIEIQVTNTANTSGSDFRAAMAEKWQNLTVKVGGMLWGNTFIPFGREGGMGESVKTAVFQK
jgi:hypothetical protein